MTALPGALLPFLSQQLHLRDGQAGQLFAVQFLAATLASAFYHWTVGRWAPAWAVPASFALMAAGAAFFVPHSLWSVRAGAAILGLALGVNIPACNLLSVALSGGQQVRALNMLNMWWGVGAVLGPTAVAHALQFRPLAAVMAGIAALLGAAATACLPLVRAFAGKASAAAADNERLSSRFP